MNLPDDFGMSVPATLAHASDRCRAPQHAHYWTHWNKDLEPARPVLRPRSVPDPSDPGATHEFESLGHVPIGCRLVLPPAGVRPLAGLVALHGYRSPPPLEADARRWTDLAARGVAVLLVRVRGYAGSRAQTGDLCASPMGWISVGLDAPPTRKGEPCTWVMAGAVADVVLACRALRAWLGETPARASERPGLFMHGESFGAGLAVIAGSQMAGRERLDRLALGLPSLGDWSWRRRHDSKARPPGIAGEIAELLRLEGQRAGEVLQTVRLFDSAVHGRRVRGPVLCKLAERDDVCPAPTSAAVFNGLGSGAGRKWRFVVRAGHFDAGIADARRHALFERVLTDFLDPPPPPPGAMAAWEPWLSGGLPPPG